MEQGGRRIFGKEGHSERMAGVSDGQQVVVEIEVYVLVALIVS